MQEYWVNVYYTGIGEQQHHCREKAIYYAELAYYRKCLYRIHVKMKQNIKVFGVDIPGVYAGDGAPKPNHRPKYTNKSDWMG